LKRILVLVALLVPLAFAGCDSKKQRVIIDGIPPSLTFQDLTEQWHVLNNLQLAMTEMDADRYVELLDPNDFVFFKDPNDVQPGGQTDWGYSVDSTIAANMLGGGGSNPIVSINLELVDFKNAQWTEFDPSGSPGLYRTTVQYNFNIDTQNDIQYVTSGTPAAEFTIAERDVGGTMVWRIVEWKDLTGNLAAASPASTEASSWGRVKSLYW
jgi:hypothetical protein